MRNFRNLEVYQQSMKLCTEVYKVVRDFPDSEKYGLRSQMTRSAVSIPSNISEGASRRTKVEYGRFLSIAMGSSFELETQLTIAINIGYLNAENLKQIMAELLIIQKKLNALRTVVLA